MNAGTTKTVVIRAQVSVFSRDQSAEAQKERRHVEDMVRRKYEALRYDPLVRFKIREIEIMVEGEVTWHEVRVVLTEESI